MASNSERLREIISVLGSFGFGTIYQRQFKKQTVEESAENLRLAFESLGPSFIKIGQILSTRNDLLPEPYIKELEKLQNSSPAISFGAVDEVFTEEYGQSMEETFEYVEKEPLATGSIAQIHLVRLKSGQQMIVKVQRPHIREKLIRDIDLFIRALRSVPAIFNIIVDPVKVLQQIRRQSLEELNFLNEAQNMLRFIENHQEYKGIDAPEPYLPIITERVLTQEYISGYELTNLEELSEAGYDKSDIAKKLVISYIYQIFDNGFYHADPHPGNFIIQDGVVYFIDFGLSGNVSKFYQNILLSAMKAMLNEDIDSLMNMLLLITEHTGDVNTTTLYDDLSQLYNRYLRGGFYAIDLSAIFEDLFALALKYRLTFPDDLVLLIKTIIVVQGVAQDLDPDMDFMGIFASYILSGDRVDLSNILGKEVVLKNVSKMASAASHIPSKAERLLDNINHNRLTVNLSVKDTEKLFRQVNQIVNRLVVTLLLAAIIISSGLLIASDVSSRVVNIALIFFVVGIVLALYLLYSLIRSRH